MPDPGLSFRIKLILTVALLAVVTAFGVTYLRGRAQERVAGDAASEEAEGVPVPH